MPVEVQGTLDLSGILADGRIESDGDLTVKINGFYYDLSGLKGYYHGSCGNIVTDNNINYIYIDSSAVLNINTSGYPTGVHIRLGRVVASGGFITRIISERALFTDASSSGGMVPDTRQVIAGDGLTGGGDLSQDRTLNVVANIDGSIVVNADDIQVGILATDTQHGNHGGGLLHSIATESTSGFLSSTDKTILDHISDGYVNKNITLTAGSGLIGGGDLSANRTFDIIANIDGSIVVNANDIQVGTLATDNQHGNRGGGSLHSTVTSSVNGFMSSTDKVILDDILDGYVNKNVTIIAGAGLTGGGNLSISRTLDIVANIDGSIIANANDIQVGTLATDNQHGNRGGGSLHSIATESTAGFLSSTDKTILDHISDGYVNKNITLTAGSGLTGGGDLSANRTFNVIANADGSIIVNADDIQVGILATDIQHGNRGGGSLHSTVTESVNGFMASTDKAILDHISDGYVNKNITLTAGSGLTGGGDLSANRTFNVIANADGSIIVNADDIQIGTLASDNQHGNRGGGSLHSIATELTAGFLSSTDKTILDHISDGYVNKNITLTAGSGLTGGGDLSANRTFNVIANADGSIVVNADDIQIGTLATDNQHGNRNGGLLHAVATESTAGFLSSTDKTILDHISDGYVNKNITLTAGAGLTGGGNLSANRTFNVIANIDGSIVVNADDIQVGTLATDNQHGNRGGGTLHSAVTTSTNGFMLATDKVILNNISDGYVNKNITLTAGAGLTGGGDLSTNRTFNVIANADGSIVVNADDIQIGTLATDNQHGNRGGGSLHSTVTTSVNGFMSYTDKTKLDGIATGAVSAHGNLSGLLNDDHPQYLRIDGYRAMTGDLSLGTHNLTNVGTLNGIRFYSNSATDPVSPPPADGYMYFNTVLEETMRYDGTRSKWLSVSTLTFLAGRSGNTAAGSFYRGMDGLTFGANIGYPVPKGTLTGIAWSKTDAAASVLEVLVGGSVIATLSANSAGYVTNWLVNADFNEGFLQFRNQVGSNTTSNVQITAIIKRRI